MTEREVLALRAAYVKGVKAGRALVEYHGEATTAAITRMVDIEFPLPSAQVWRGRCTCCGAAVADVLTVVATEAGVTVVQCWHRGPDRYYCGPVKEVEA